MPKKASTTPAKQQAKKTPIAIAETDTKWEKLAKPTTAGTTTSKSTPKRQTKSAPTTPQICSPNLTYSTDETKFPHSTFPIRLDYIDGKDKRICWFQCEDHFTKHITRYKITKYEAITNDMALVGQVTGRKSTRKR